MDITPPADVEAITIGHLLADPRVDAIFSNRIHGDLPKSFASKPLDSVAALPTVWIHQVGDNPVDRDTGHLIRTRIQAEVFAATKPDARDGIGAIWAAMLGMPAAHAGGVVTTVRVDIGITWSPDPDLDLPRYLAVFAVYGHPPR